MPHDGDMRDTVTRAGAAAMARAGESAVPADPSTALASGRGVVESDENEARSAVVLPDEVVARILRFVLEGEREGDGAHARWSVGGRFRVPGPDAARRRSLERRGGLEKKTDGASDDETGPPRTRRRAVAKRGCLRLVSKQWRRVLDRTCVEVEVRKAVVFGDDALAGLATALRDGDESDDCVAGGDGGGGGGGASDKKASSATGDGAAFASSPPSRPARLGAPRRLVLQGSHLCDGAFRLTTRGISAFAAALPSLVALHVERTGMDVAEVLRVAAACPNLAELAVDGGARGGGGGSRGGSAKTNVAPFESALLHAMPCTSTYAAMDALAALFRGGAERLRSVALRRAPGVFADASFFLVRDEASRARDGRTDGSDTCAALRDCASLRSLALEEVGVSDAIGASLVRWLPPNLETFAVDGDDVGRRTGAALAAGLAGHAVAPARFPALSSVRIPRRAAFGAAAAAALDRALARRAATRARDERSGATALLVRVAPDASSRRGAAAERDAFATRVLRRWRISNVTSVDPRARDTTGATTATNEPPRERSPRHDWCLSSEARRASPRASESDSATRAAREALRYLAAFEDWEGSERVETEYGADWSPRLVWATTCVGAPHSALERARDWLKRRPRDDSLAAVAARVAARERFSRLAGALDFRRGVRLDATNGRSTHTATTPGSSSDRDQAAFDAVAAAVARDTRTIVFADERSEDEVEDEDEDVETARRDARRYASERARGEENAPSVIMTDGALRRALACVALPAALARAAAEDDAASGRDATGASPVPSLPPVVLDLVHDATCALLVAEDLARRDSERDDHRHVSTRKGARSPNPPLLDDAMFRGGSAWCALEATARTLASSERRDGEKNGATSTVRGVFNNAAGFLAPDALPRWIDAGVAGSPEDAALAADVAASALSRLAGHESVSLGARGLRALAKILGEAAALVPGDAFFFANEDSASTKRKDKNSSWRRLHDAVHSVFAAREFAPLLRGNVGGNRACSRRDADDETRRRGVLVASSPEPRGPRYVVSWSQWLHAVGAPPPLASAAAAAAAEELRAKSEAYERMEAEAASLRARMSRSAADLRRVALDVRASHGYHREPARELLLRAHAAVGWRVERRGESGGESGGASFGASSRCAFQQTTLVEAFEAKRNQGRFDAEAVTKKDASSSARPPRSTDVRSVFANFAKTDAVHRVPREGWREEALAALDALFAHAARSAPFFPNPDAGESRGTPKPGWSLVNDVGDATRVFAREWERRACAATLAWYVETRDTAPKYGEENEQRTPCVDDVLRVLGAANASDACVASDGRERFPVDAMARLRRDGRGRASSGLGSLGSNAGENGGDGDAIVVELDARLRWNLMLDA